MSSTDVHPVATADGMDPSPAGPEEEADRVIAMFAALVQPLGLALPPTAEVLLHDLRKLPNSVVAICGDVTHRKVGDPATDLLLEAAARGNLQTRTGYETRLPDGRRMKSSTMILRDFAGTPVAALCINVDLSAWTEVNRISQLMLGDRLSSEPTTPEPVAASPVADDHESAELFVTDVDELEVHLLRKSIDGIGVTVDLMHKRHKVAVVKELNSRGFFMLKNAVDKAAAALSVTRFTIYNYLNEITGDTEPNEKGTNES